MSTKEEQKDIILPKQCRAARELLGWKQVDLVEKSGIGIATIADFERGSRSPIVRTLKEIRRTFEDAGVVFVNNGEIGVKVANN